MKFNKLNIIVFVGLLAIIGVITMQLVMLKQAFMFERNEVADKIHFALQDVVNKIYRDNGSELPTASPIKKVADDYYVVNVNDVFEAKILEYYLKSEFQKVKLDIDYEYAIYDCASDEMMYGNYINAAGFEAENDIAKCENCFTKKEGLIYYFAIRFPHLHYNYSASLQQYWVYTGVLFLVLIIYVYSVFTLLKQKRYTELQKDFINNMTHEFKTPLSSILIASNYAVKQDVIEQNPKLNKYLKIIIEQSNKLNQHIERILNVAKADSDLMGLDKKEFNIVETLQLAKDNAELKYPATQITFTSSKDNYTVAADAFHFYNIVYNIIENAIKYSNDTPEVAIQITETAKCVDLQFTDNGSGIPPQHLEHVFDKFYRVPRENKKEIEGFGIGLFYVKKICELHGWKIKIENNTDKGITITIGIPKSSIL
ncbi:sensor histidine kinase [Flavobacterium litorale]|uniref:histidine kinase n=1 Tax=Flavobacterium litorale TaxID=2856519 RepID=A0ABX8VDK6_9FLAO|nr:HAMP domain-containing sensor histidine kinase [Flavobacterium litorale]QYJ69126.1 HAMP domain-containing histidine kinase [Flavobacterium litorale]